MSVVAGHQFGAIVLAGGKSSRMGQDKALLQHGDTSLLDYIESVLERSGAGEVLIARNAPGGNFVKDNFFQQGPLAGIEACLRHSRFEAVVIIPVDLPNLSASSIFELVNAYFEAGFRPTRFEQSELPCVVHNSPLTRSWLFEQLSDPQGERSVRSFLNWCDAQHIYCNDMVQITNTNTPEQWRQAGFDL